jgi:hypothetical protein
MEQGSERIIAIIIAAHILWSPRRVSVGVSAGREQRRDADWNCNLWGTADARDPW